MKNDHDSILKKAAANNFFSNEMNCKHYNDNYQAAVAFKPGT